MKRANTWYASILIASALLLIGNRSASADAVKPNPVPSSSHIEKQNESGSFSQQQGQPEPTPFNLTNSSPSPNLGNETRKDQDQTDGDGMSSCLMITATIVMTLATGAIAWFNFQLVGVTDEMKKATAKAAEFTRLAYLASRPYVVADEFVLKNFTTRNRLPDDAVALTFMVANFQLRNVGKGPAIITAARAKLKMLPDDPKSRKFLPNPSDDWGDLSDCVSIPLSARVIPAETAITASTGFAGLPSEEDYKAISMTYEKHIVVYGLLEYIDAAGQTYKGGFGVLYRPKRMFGDDDFFSIGPIKYNLLR
jgi:hypothetical protein